MIWPFASSSESERPLDHVNINRTDLEAAIDALRHGLESVPHLYTINMGEMARPTTPRAG